MKEGYLGVSVGWAWTLGFSLAHDLMGCGMEPLWGSGFLGSLLEGFAPCAPPPLQAHVCVHVRACVLTLSLSLNFCE